MIVANTALGFKLRGPVTTLPNTPLDEELELEVRPDDEEEDEDELDVHLLMKRTTMRKS